MIKQWHSTEVSQKGLCIRLKAVVKFNLGYVHANSRLNFIKTEGEKMGSWHYDGILASYLIQQHSSHSTDNNRYSCVRSHTNEPVYTCLSEDRGLFTRSGQNGENRNYGKLWLSPQCPSNPQTTGKASVKQTWIWSGSLSPWVLILNSNAGGKRRRHETRCFLYLPCLSAHTHGHIKAFGWRLEHELKSGQSNPAVLLESKELWCNILIYAGSQLVV